MKAVLFATILVLFATACGKEESCEITLMDLLDLVTYDGQEIGCRTFYDLYLHDGQEYAVINNYCADFVVITATDCLGNTRNVSTIPGGEYIRILGLKSD